MLMYFCFQWANYFFIAWMPVYLQEQRHFSEAKQNRSFLSLFIAAIIGLLAGGFLADWLVKKKGLRFGRRLWHDRHGHVCMLILVAAITPQNNTSGFLSCCSKWFLWFLRNVVFGVCSDIGRNNSWNCGGRDEFFRANGSILSRYFFWKNCGDNTQFELSSFCRDRHLSDWLPLLVDH